MFNSALVIVVVEDKTDEQGQERQAIPASSSAMHLWHLTILSESFLYNVSGKVIILVNKLRPHGITEALSIFR